MTWYALQNVGDAIEATREFLLPVTLARWVRLAVVALFVGGGLSVNAPANVGSSAPPQGSGEFLAPTGPDQVGELLSGDLLLVIVAVGTVLGLLAILWSFLGAVMEFVFVESLRRDAVHLRRYSKQFWRKGLRLFAFRVLVGLGGLVLAAGIGFGLLAAIAGTSPAAWEPTQLFSVALLAIPVLFVVFALVSLLNGFTTAFVVPVMLAEDRAVLSAWRRFWPTLRGNLGQYAVYVAVAFVLAIAVGIVAATVVGLGAVVLAIPFVIVGGIVFLLAGGSATTPVIAVFALLAVVFALAVMALVGLVQVPLRTFVRVYTLLVLGDSNGDFDVVPELRATVRQ